MSTPATGRSRVLVIEDSAADRDLFRRTLGAFDLSFAGSGEEGLERLGTEAFDLVLLDHHLPGIDGGGVLDAIRAGERADVPVVVISGVGSERLAVDLLKRGASDYLTKDDLRSHRVVADALHAALSQRAAEARRVRDQADLRRRHDELERSLRQLREHQGSLIQSEKLAGMGQLVAGVAHEINNPLAYVTNNLAVLDRDVGQILSLLNQYRARYGPDLADDLRLAEEEVDLNYLIPNVDRLFRSTRTGLKRVGEIVAGLRDFSRLDEAEFQAVDPNEPVRTTVEMVRYQARQKDIHLRVETEAMPPVWCSPGRLNQVLLNLLVNAIQAVDDGATITVRSFLRPEADEFAYEVADNGPGIPEAIRGKIFDPFFTTKPQGVGTGLGLWIAYNIVGEHQGRIELATEPGQGTTFTVILPLHQPDEPA